MTGSQASLSNLRDIVVPDPPPLWPPAPGVWVVVGIAVLVALTLVWCWRRVRKRNAHRKAGLALLAGAGTTHDVSVVLKRVALAVFPREQVASLYGKDWVEFLNGTCSHGNFAECRQHERHTSAGEILMERAATWIRHHRIPPRNPAGTER